MPAAAPIIAFLARFVFPILGTIGTFLLGTTVGTVRTAATTLGTALAVLTFFFLLRVLFMLVRAYISILLLIIFGPIIIAFGAAAPGSNTLSFWFKNLLANILVFPATGLVIGLGGVITNRILAAAQANTPFWSPPLLGTEPTFLAGMIALGLLIIIPEIDGMIKQALNVRGIEFLPGGISPQIQRGGQEFQTQWRERMGDQGGAFVGRMRGILGIR